jgi:hypothetical protein
MEPVTPEEMWKKFIDHLTIVQPLGKPDDNGNLPKHTNFLGSVAAYRKIFIEANKT